MRVLQLNLCSSGIAGCYTGRSTEVAAALLRAETPDLVTLNEVCSDDVPELERALAEALPDAEVASAFQPARNRDTGEPYRCRNGEQYGIGVVSRWPATARDGGIYPAQDPEDPEERAWLCLDAAATPALAVCTTHLAYTVREVTRAQCADLFGRLLAPRPAVVLGADLNLGPGDSPDLLSCVPEGWARTGDGGQQHVMATPGYTITDARTVDLDGSTDHPGLLVTLGALP